MTLEQLKSFCAIVEHGGFRAAANNLYKSQSAVSIALGKLELELNLSLFQRKQYRPALTNEGKALYKKAVVILKHSDEFSLLAQHFSMGAEPELRIAMSGITPIEPILDVLKCTSDHTPSTQLSLQMENLNGTIERLKDGDADIAISESNKREDGLEYQHLTCIELITIVSSQSSFAKHASTLNERDMEGSTQVLVRDTSTHTHRLTAGVVEGTNHWIVNDFMMKKRVIVANSGWGRLPKHMVQEDIKKGILTPISNKQFPSISVDIQAIRHKHKPIGPVASALWQRLQAIDWT
ncbi:MAG: LysR family transcriptional regulator [Mariprofundaceae bacterium]|nr:LysR family transcriptional regulator [Mariprofundaceae bacterium]